MANLLLSKPILMTIPDEWQSEVENILEKEEFSVLVAASKDDALRIIKSRQLSAVIVTSDWAIDNDAELIKLTLGKIPTLTLIRDASFRQYGQDIVFDKIYNPSALQEFCTIPFTADELLGRLRRALDKAGHSK